jgi:hypothetical protein
MDFNYSISVIVTLIVAELLKKYHGTRKYAILFIIIGAAIAGIIAYIIMHWIHIFPEI